MSEQNQNQTQRTNRIVPTGQDGVNKPQDMQQQNHGGLQRTTAQPTTRVCFLPFFYLRFLTFFVVFLFFNSF